jgi:hypothetical protein
MYHYTDKYGYNAIRVNWCFKAGQPPPRDHPFGAYFTTLPPGTRNLPLRLRVSNEKTTYVFVFVDAGDLKPLLGDRGEVIFYSPVDYKVARDRRRGSGKCDKFMS